MRKTPRILRTPEDLVGAGLIEHQSMEALRPVAAMYAVAITPALADLIDVRDPDDPIARQFVPSEAERDIAPPMSAAIPLAMTGTARFRALSIAMTTAFS